MGQWPSSNHNDVDQYVGSPFPYVTGSVVVGTTPVEIKFPYVTRWVVVTNDGDSSNGQLRVGFTENGVNANPAAQTNYFLLPSLTGSCSSGRLELKLDRMFVRADAGTTLCTVLAGYTSIPVGDFPTLTGSANFTGIG